MSDNKVVHLRTPKKADDDRLCPYCSPCLHDDKCLRSQMANTLSIQGGPIPDALPRIRKVLDEGGLAYDERDRLPMPDVKVDIDFIQRQLKRLDERDRALRCEERHQQRVMNVYCLLIGAFGAMMFMRVIALFTTP